MEAAPGAASLSHRIGPAFLQLGSRVGAKVDPWFAWLTIAVLSCPLVVSAGTVSYQYDILKRLTQVTFPGATTIHYTYDRAGNQTARPVTNAFDADLDGYVDVVDVCPAVPDPEQLDTDRDGTGNACDQDDDNDGYSDIVDNCPLQSPGQAPIIIATLAPAAGPPEPAGVRCLGNIRPGR